LDDPYEFPEAPELVIDTSEASVEDAVEALVQLLSQAGVLP
jgi:adenylylsulfate kinase-like enzyme